MNVSEALEGSPFDFHYRRKFERIVEKAGVGDLDLSQDWYEIRRRLQTTMSFNIWGLLIGGLWAVYRGVPYAVPVILFVAASIVAPSYLGLEDGFLRALSYGLGGVFALYGNSWLLGSYLSMLRDYGDEALVERETRPSLLHGLLAVSVLAITGFVVETPAADLRSLAQSVVPIQEEYGPDKLTETAESTGEVIAGVSTDFWEDERRKWNHQCIGPMQKEMRQATRAWTQGAYQTFPGMDGKVENYCNCVFDQIESNVPEDEWRAQKGPGNGFGKKMAFYVMACDSTLD